MNSIYKVILLTVIILSFNGCVTYIDPITPVDKVIINSNNTKYYHRENNTKYYHRENNIKYYHKNSNHYNNNTKYYHKQKYYR